MNKKINTGKLKVKYVLGNHTSLPNYPDVEDVIYDLIADYCNRTIKEIKFTNVSLQKKFSISESKCSEIIEKLKSLNALEEVNSTSAYTTYKLIKNPYI